MKTIAEKFIGKTCLIRIWNDAQKGIIREVTDGAIMLETKSGWKALNLDFVVGIEEIASKK